MDYEITRDGTKVSVAVTGRLDAISAPGFESDVLAVVAPEDDVTFDLDQLDYISSAGLRVLLVVYKRVAKTGAMRILNVRDTVADVLDASGFAAIFSVA